MQIIVANVLNISIALDRVRTLYRKTLILRDLPGFFYLPAAGRQIPKITHIAEVVMLRTILTPGVTF